MNGSASAQFAAELRRLYQAAGKPPLKQVVMQASRRKPPVSLTTSGLSDWLNGRAVPRSADGLRFLVGYLRAVAQRTGNQAGRTAEQWEALRTRAWTEKHLHRGGRPKTRGSAATSQGETSQPIGRVIGELDEIDAIALEVHQAVTVDGQDAEGELILPPYLPRMHDQRLVEEVRRAESGSRIVLVVGGSSTGKTRACWEAIRAALPHWRVWHPLVPQRSHALLEVLRSGRIAAHTVIWLNEAQLYLGAGYAGRHVAAALQELVQQSAGPVLVIGSLWPQYLDALTEPNDQQHAATRHLVEAACIISVPAEFSDTDLAGSRQLIRSDPRLRIAAGYGRRISQFLAGAFALEARYRRGDEAAQAVLWAAMDAYRLGQTRALTEAFLHNAALSYLHPDAAEHAGPDWFGAAMTYLTRPCHGVAGPLARLKATDDPHDGTVAYRLADYLDQLGRRSRSGVYPPTGFWDAVSVHVNDPADLASFAAAAGSRRRARRAFQLFRQAARWWSRVGVARSGLDSMGWR